MAEGAASLVLGGRLTLIGRAAVWTDFIACIGLDGVTFAGAVSVRVVVEIGAASQQEQAEAEEGKQGGKAEAAHESYKSKGRSKQDVG